MVQIDIDYRGELRCGAVHGPSGAQLITDAPVDNHGKGASYSPTDLLATALGTCMLTIMGIAATREDIDLKGTRVTVVKGMVADPLRRVGRLEVRFELPRIDELDVRERLEAAARTCPVAESLRPGIEVPVEFAWGAL
jgi:putative redox protein